MPHNLLLTSCNFFKAFIEAQLIYKAMLVTAVQQSESVIYIHMYDALLLNPKMN